MGEKGGVPLFFLLVIYGKNKRNGIRKQAVKDRQSVAAQWQKRLFPFCFCKYGSGDFFILISNLELEMTNWRFGN